MKPKQKRENVFKGSALVYSLIILFVMLTVVLAMSAVNINERNNAGTTGDSVQAFQTANSGSELFAKVMKTNPATVGAIAAAFGGCNVATGNLTGSISGGGSYTIELFKSDGTTQINCSSDAALASNTVVSIKSTGTFSGSSRAIQVALAAGTCKMIKGTASVGVAQSVTFPVGSFTVAPIVIIQSFGTATTAGTTGTYNITSTGFKFSATGTVGSTLTWVAFDSACFPGSFTVS